MRRSLLFLLLLLPVAARAAQQDTFTAEGNSGITVVTIQIRSTAPQPNGLTGQWRTVDGTATVGDNDYIAATGDFVIPPGQSVSNPIQLQVVGDTKIEADETFTVEVFNIPVGAIPVDPGPYIIHINNDDVPVLTVSNPSTKEGNVGLTNLTFFVGITAPAAVTITANYATSDGTATAPEDYQSATGTVTFAPGETSKIVNVSVNGDTKVEPDETMRLTVSRAGSADAVGTGTIINDDVFIPVLLVGNARVTEGNSGITPMTFTVAMTGPAAAAVQVTYATSDGTATAGDDYQPASGTLVFAPGEPAKTITVNVIGDTKLEPDETFTLTVTPAAGAPVVATGTIVNDDAPAVTTLRIVSGDGQRARLGQPLPQPLVVEVLNSLGAPVSGVAVQWRVTSGDATLTPATSTTNAQGRASTVVTLNSVGALTVQASAGDLAPVNFTLSSETLFEQRAKGPVAVPIARALDAICARNEQTFAAACRALSLAEDVDLSPLLERIAPQQSGAQSKVASEMISAITRGIASRLGELRSGVRHFSVQKVSLSISGQPIAVGSLATELMQAPPPAAAAADESDYNGWSGFLSGNLGDGERIGRSGLVGFDLKSRGLMAGVDRQFGDNVLGLSVHAMDFDADLSESAGSLDTTGYALSIYGSRSGLFASKSAGVAASRYDGLHVDGSLTLGRSRFDAEHVVAVGSLPLSRARSKNDANLFALTGGTGLEAHRGRTDFDLTLSGTWSRADIDDLSEEGSGPLVLFVEGHEIESAVVTAGLNVRSVFAVPFGDLLPSLRGEMVHELKGGARVVTARFLRDRLNTSFTVPVDRPDENYGKLSAGLQAVFARGLSAFIEVTQDVLRSDLHFRTVQVNVSKSF